MTMDWLFADGVAPFSVALLLMFGLGLIEIIGLMIGVSASSSLHHMTPDVHHPHVDLDIDASGHGFASVLGWLQIGRAPFLILLVLFLLGFGLSGILLQQLCLYLLGHFAHGGLMAVPSVLIGASNMHIGGRLAHRYLPRDETESISTEQFIGQTVTITVGEARFGHPAEAKFKDQYGHTHYVMVEPDEDSYRFAESETALIIRQEGQIYRVVPNIDHLIAKTRNLSS